MDTLPSNAWTDFSASTRRVQPVIAMVSADKTATLSLSVRPKKVAFVMVRSAPFAQNAPQSKPSLSDLNTEIKQVSMEILLVSAPIKAALLTSACNLRLPEPQIVRSPPLITVGQAFPDASAQPISRFSPRSVSVLPPARDKSVLSPVMRTSCSVSFVPIPTVSVRLSNSSLRESRPISVTSRLSAMRISPLGKSPFPPASADRTCRRRLLRRAPCRFLLCCLCRMRRRSRHGH